MVANAAAILLLSALPSDSHSAPIPATVVVVSETLKLCATLVQVVAVQRSALRPFLASALSAEWMAAYAVPSALYTANNTLQVFVLKHAPPTVFELLLSTRVVFTAVAYRVVLGRRVSRRQLWATVVLCIGVAVTQMLPTGRAGGDAGSAAGGAEAPVDATGGPVAAVVSGGGGGVVAALWQWRLRLPLPSVFGVSGSDAGLPVAVLLLIALYCCISVAAGVFTEVLGKRAPSLAIGNTNLYGIGVLTGVIMLAWQLWWAGGGVGLVVRGWGSWRPWAAAASTATLGLLVSSVVRSTDMVVKTMAAACSNVLMYAFTVAVWGAPLSWLYGVALVCVTSGVYMYTAPGAGHGKTE